MQNIIEILKAIGLELSDEQQTAVNKAVAENYKTVAEFDKKLGKVEAERDGLKEQLADVNNTLKTFDGVDVEGMKKQLAEAQQKAEDAEKAFNAKLSEREFDDALREAFDSYKFSSEYAKSAIMAEVKSKGLPMVDGKIVGLGEVMDGIKKRDENAFTSDKPKAQFTTGFTSDDNGKKYETKEDILKIKDAKERQQAIRDNIGLFVQQK